MAIKLTLDDQEIEIKNSSTDLNASLHSSDMEFHASGENLRHACKHLNKQTS